MSDKNSISAALNQSIQQQVQKQAANAVAGALAARANSITLGEIPEFFASLTDGAVGSIQVDTIKGITLADIFNHMMGDEAPARKTGKKGKKVAKKTAAKKVAKKAPKRSKMSDEDRAQYETEIVSYLEARNGEEDFKGEGLSDLIAGLDNQLSGLNKPTISTLLKELAGNGKIAHNGKNGRGSLYGPVGFFDEVASDAEAAAE